MQRTFTALFAVAGLLATVVLAADRPATVPGQSSPPHRHNANVLVYVLEGALVMGVKGKEPVTVSSGQTFYESPADVHEISRNASTTERAKFLVVLIHDQGASTMLPATPEK